MINQIKCNPKRYLTPVIEQKANKIKIKSEVKNGPRIYKLDLQYQQLIEQRLGDIRRSCVHEYNYLKNSSKQEFEFIKLGATIQKTDLDQVQNPKVFARAIQVDYKPSIGAPKILTFEQIERSIAL